MVDFDRIVCCHRGLFKTYLALHKAQNILFVACVALSWKQTQGQPATMPSSEKLYGDYLLLLALGKGMATGVTGG